MIQDIKIKNYLSFKDETVFSFEATKDTTLEDTLIKEVAPGVRLLRFAMILGGNGSGKSNLLYIFNFLRNFWRNRACDLEETTSACPFLLDAETKNQPCEVEIRFWIKGVKYWYIVKVDEHTTYDERLYYYKSVQPTLVFKRELTDGHSVVSFNPALKVSNAVVDELQVKCLNNMSVIAARGGVNTAIPYLDEMREWAKTSIMSIIDPETRLFDDTKSMIHDNQDIHDFILDYLHSANFNISNILTKELTENNEISKKLYHATLSIINSQPELAHKVTVEPDFRVLNMQFIHRVENDRGIEEYPLSSNMQSYGTRRSMGIETFIYMALKRNALIPIDEFDTSMHPELMEYSIRRFLESDSEAQLLITTHYDPLLNKIGELIRKDCVWFTDKERNGSTNLYPLVEFKGLNRLSSIQNSYVEGKFGAIQNVINNK